MKAALNEAIALRYEIRIWWNFPKRKRQNSWRDGIGHSFRQKNLGWDQQQSKPTRDQSMAMRSIKREGGTNCTKVQWNARLSQVISDYSSSNTKPTKL